MILMKKNIIWFIILVLSLSSHLSAQSKRQRNPLSDMYKDPYWQKRFVDKGLPIVGDDIKSQVGATIVHRVLARLFEDRGVRLDRTYQLNFGGNTDFLNMLEED